MGLGEDVFEADVVARIGGLGGGVEDFDEFGRHVGGILERSARRMDGSCLRRRAWRDLVVQRADRRPERAIDDFK